MAEYLRFVIKEQRLEIKGGPIIYSDTISYIGATFLFDPEWNGLDRVLHFQKDGEATVYDIAIVGDKIDPSTSGMNLSGGIWQFWIHGTEIVEGESVRRLTTNKTSLEVKLSGVMHGEPLPTIRETISEQILSKAAHAERNAITSASISVNSTIGTPSATVSFSQQTDTGKQIDFAFSGVKGEKGDTGEKGAKGDTGAKGDKGDTGAKGDKGDTGAKGDKGDTGATGPKGDKGDTGVKGDKGDTGAAGPKGDTGERGAKGDKGDTGASAGFGTPTAVIDANVGTPYVTVTASGPDTAKVFAFDFKNLKGETGATGTTDFDQLVNRPKYNDADMTHSTNVPEVKTAAWDAKYDKPSGGIPKTDLASAVQVSLGKADSALQSVPATYRTSAAQDVINNALDGRLDTLESYVPSETTASNKLADKAFVNSSISTNTATFRGTSAAGLTEAQFLAWANGLTKTNNDYVFWNTTDTAGNVLFKRYKYNGTNWVYEYSLNNSSFTAAQWAAINSGVTSSDVAAIAGKENTSNKVTSISSASTDVQYPSAKCVYDIVGNIEAVIDSIRGVS